MRATTIEGENAFALRKFHMTDGQNTRDQITSDRRSKRAWSKCVLRISYILIGSPNECCLHTCDACVITTWRLGLGDDNNWWKEECEGSKLLSAWKRNCKDLGHENCAGDTDNLDKWLEKLDIRNTISLLQKNYATRKSKDLSFRVIE